MAAVGAWIHEPSWRCRTNPSQVRRSLFGPTDHEANQAFLDEEWDQIRQEDTRRWNFDFDTEVPIVCERKDDQRYQWYPVQRTYDGDPPVDADSPEMRGITPVDPGRNGGDGPDTRRDTVQVKLPESSVNQTQITDYMKKRKSSLPGPKNGMTQPPTTEPPTKNLRQSPA